MEPATEEAAPAPALTPASAPSPQPQSQSQSQLSSPQDDSPIAPSDIDKNVSSNGGANTNQNKNDDDNNTHTHPDTGDSNTNSNPTADNISLPHLESAASSTKSRPVSGVIPPFWQRHERSVSRASLSSLAQSRIIRLEDHTADPDSETSRGLWASSVAIEDHVVVQGKSGVGSYVVWNCRIQTLDVSLVLAGNAVVVVVVIWMLTFPIGRSDCCSNEVLLVSIVISSLAGLDSC